MKLDYESKEIPNKPGTGESSRLIKVLLVIGIVALAASIFIPVGPTGHRGHRPTRRPSGSATIPSATTMSAQ